MALCSSVLCSWDADSRRLVHEFQFDSIFRRQPPMVSKFSRLTMVTLQQLHARCFYHLVLVASHPTANQPWIISKFTWRFEVGIFPLFSWRKDSLDRFIVFSRPGKWKVSLYKGFSTCSGWWWVFPSTLGLTASITFLLTAVALRLFLSGVRGRGYNCSFRAWNLER